MARKKKTSLLGKLTNWIKGSLEKFANEGFSKEGQAKRKKAVPSFLKVRKKRTKPKPVKQKAVRAKVSVKKKPVKKSLKAVTPKKSLGSGRTSPAPKAEIILKKKQPAVSEKPVLKKSNGIFVGKIALYFEKAKACAFNVENAEIKDGAKIRIVGPTTDFKMNVKSIQINRIPVPSGRPGEDIGIGVTKPVVVGDSVYLV